MLTVDAVDAENTSVTVTLADKSGKVIETKTLGSVKELWEILPQHQEAMKKLQLMHGDVLAEINIDSPTKGGKANLNLYTGVQHYSVDQPLPGDDRFTIRPDVCGHCYQLNEVLIDNAETIVLDRDNPVFEGPKKADGHPMFRIVLDSFDGEMVQAWHVETVVGKKGRVFKSGNLAFRPRRNLDVLIGANGSIENFLRQSMVERMAYIEYWRRGLHAPAHIGDHAARAAMKMQ